MRHDVGTGNANARGRREPGTAKLPPAFLVDAAPDCGGYRTGHVRTPSRLVRSEFAKLDRVNLDRPHRPVGRLAFLRARGAVHRPSQPEHVDPDRNGYRRGLRWTKIGRAHV